MTQTNKTKYYVVWKGRNPGIYTDWNDALEQIQNFPGARYKAFKTSQEATQAFRQANQTTEKIEIGRLIVGASAEAPTPASRNDYTQFPEIDLNAWAVDASCLGNPGIMEYRGVEIATGKTIFKAGPFKDATNNIGEFLAIVHALALMHQQQKNIHIYTDSVTAMAWVRKKHANTNIKPTTNNQHLLQLIQRAQTWLKTHTITTQITKWDTDRWGEIPADYGRK